MNRKHWFQSIAAGAFMLVSSDVAAVNFSNPALISIPSSGSATPYPSIISISGFSGAITDVNVTLHGLTHTFPTDLDILLVGPAGQSVLLMSDVGGGSDLDNATLTFDDQAASSVPNPIVAGTYKPTNVGNGDNIPAPAPSGPWGTQLSVFNGNYANGSWRLFVFDDGLFADGSIDGWSLAINSVGGTAPVPEAPPIVILGFGLLVGSAWLRRRLRG